MHYQKAAQVNHTDAMLKVGMAFAHGKVVVETNDGIMHELCLSPFTVPSIC